MSLFETCSVESDGDNTGILQCAISHLEAQAALKAEQDKQWLLVIAGGLIFFMQTGFAMLCAGCVRKKNVQNTMLKNLLDACGAAIAWFLFGYAFAYGETDHNDITFIGTKNFLARGNVDPAFWFFQYAFSATAVTIVAGTLAERCQMAAYLCYSVFLTGFVYPVVAHAVWSSNGLFSALQSNPIGGVGVLDFAGSGVVHLTGGTTALIATYILGSRRGRFYDSRGKPLAEPKVIHGHSIALQLMGTMVLWFGWYGFNPGSALLLGSDRSGYIAAVAAANTSLAAATGAVTALFTNLYLKERKTGEYSFDITMAMNGSLSGLVAITAPCGSVEMWAAILIGMVAAWIYMGGSALLIKLRLDDAVDAIPVHMFNGLWGLVATGLFSTQSGVNQVLGVDNKFGFFYHLGSGEFDITFLGVQVAVGLAIMAWTSVAMSPFFLWLNYQGWFRSDSLEELVGLDASYHHGASQVYQEEASKADYEKLRKRRGGGDSVVSGQSGDDESWMGMSATTPEQPRRSTDAESQASEYS